MERAGKPITCNPGGVCMFNLCGTYRWTGTGTQIRKGVGQNRKKKTWIAKKDRKYRMEKMYRFEDALRAVFEEDSIWGVQLEPARRWQSAALAHNPSAELREARTPP